MSSESLSDSAAVYFFRYPMLESDCDTWLVLRDGDVADGGPTLASS